MDVEGSNREIICGILRYLSDERERERERERESRKGRITKLTKRIQRREG
jgi:hypothetical protein